MNDARALLAAHLRQMAALGGRDLFLDGMSARAFARAFATWTGPAEPSDPVAISVPTDVGGDAGRATATSAVLPPLRAASVERADGNGALAVLAEDAAGCTRCRLHESRKTVVFGVGNPVADVLVVGEAPGQEEDRRGEPFVGPAGKLLDLLLLSAGFPRSDVYICNVLKCRPPNNRNPLPDEAEMCTTHFLHPQLDAIQPRVVVAVGKFAAQALLGTDDPIGRLRGRIHTYRGTPLVVSYHPAFLLRSPHMTRAAWQDFQLLRQVLDEQS